MESINQEQDTLADEISFKEILMNTISWIRYIMSKWPVILIFAVIGGLIGFVRANNKKLEYIATSTFILQESGNISGQGNEFASVLGFNLPEAGGLFQGDNLIQLYRTRFMIKKTLLSVIPESKNEHVIDRYLKINGLSAAWKQHPVLKHMSFFNKGNKKYNRMQDSILSGVIADIRNNYLRVYKAERQEFMSVEVRSKDEEFAKILNDAMVTTVNDFYIQTKTKRSMDNIKLLKHQTDSIRAALNGAMHGVVNTIQLNLNPAREVLRLPSQRSQVSVETNRNMLNELVRDLELSKMAVRREMPLIQMMDEPVFPLEKYRESRAKAIIIGGLLAAILIIFCLTVFYLYKKIMHLL